MEENVRQQQGQLNMLGHMGQFMNNYSLRNINIQNPLQFTLKKSTK